MTDDPCVHRRSVLLRGVAGAAGLVLADGPVRAEFPKATQQQAGYIVRNEPQAHMCAQCVYFIGPSDCKVVEGPIRPLGTCDYYED